MILGLSFPPIENLVEWPAFLFEGTFYEFNKIALINLIAVVLTTGIFVLGNKRQLVPTGMQNLAESAVDFIDKGVIQQAIGPDGLRYLPFLTTVFFFVFFGNLFEIIPYFHMPANARMANPLFLGVLTLVLFTVVGLKHQGPKYFWNVAFPPGVPTIPLKLLVAFIELLSTFIVRPFSLAVRLFANMLAGHILLVTFGVLCISLFALNPLAVVLPLSFGMLVGLTGFELMVAFLQGYVFAILAAVYIGGALHPEH